MTGSKAPKAPEHLSAEAKLLWRRVLRRYVLEAHHLVLFPTALEAFDRAREAKALLDREGLTVPGRYGPRTHPAAAIERDSRIAFARLLRELGLDLEPNTTSGPRPPSPWR